MRGDAVSMSRGSGALRRAAIRNGDPLILFLDFDGVLHPDPCADARRLFERAPRLAEALEPFPEVEVVASTAWRNLMPFERLRGLLPARLAARVIAITPTFGTFDAITSLVPYRRQAECAQWLRVNQRPADAWLALDDRPHWFSPYCENVIDCNSAVGFEPVVEARLASALITARARRRRASAAQPAAGAQVLPKSDASAL
jgi:hypothetical protein